MAYIEHHRPIKMNNVTLCHLPAMQGHQNQNEKYDKENKRQKAEQHHSRGEHAWKISPIQREVVDVEIANRINVQEHTSQEGEKTR